MPKKRLPVPVAIPLAAGITAVSFSSIFVKWSGAPVSIQAMYRLLFTLILISPFSYSYLREMKELSKKNILLLVSSGFLLALHFLLWMGSLKLTTVASSTILLSLQPIFAMTGAWFLFKERIPKKALMGIGIAILGACLISWGDIGISKRNLVGDLLSLIGTAVVAIHLLIGQKLMREISSYIYSFFVFLNASFFLAIYNLVMKIPFTGYSKNDWIVIIGLAVIPTVFGHFLFNWLLSYVTATTISVSILGEPVGASILAFFLLKEALSPFQWAGGALVLCGLYFFLMFREKKKAAARNDFQQLKSS